jgi:hypothetical protein
MAILSTSTQLSETATPGSAEDFVASLDLDVTIPSIGSSDQVVTVSNLASSSDVIAVSGDLTSHFIVPSLGDTLIHLHSDSKDLLPLSGPAVPPFSTVDPQSVIATALQGLNPAQVKNLFGDTIQSAFRDVIASLKPTILETVQPERFDAPVKRSYADSITSKSAVLSRKVPAPPVPTASAPAVPAPSTSANALDPMVVDEDGFQTVTRRPFTNTYPTIDHPNLRRTSYTIFRLHDPINRTSQLIHAGQILLFCTASTRIIADEYHAATLPAGYIAFATAFNEGARITPKRFATFSIHTGAPIIPSDPITIVDFRIDRDYVRALERTSPRVTSPITPDSINGKKSVLPKSPDELKFRKHADTPYSPSTTRRDKAKNKAKATGSSNTLD